jgi:ABC-2 type transport system ATP-binding protein
MNVEITGLNRRFGRTMAVAGVDLRAGPGVFGLLGPNGAGKTSLLRMMATAIPPTSGRLRLLGRDPGSYGPRREIRRRLGYLPQNLGYYPGFTVGEFVEYFALLKEVPAAQIPAAVAVAIERVELAGRSKTRLRALSAGSRRRSSTSPSCCCWTSRRPGSTPSSGWRSGPCCASWVCAPPSWSARTWSRTSGPPARGSH